MASPTQNLLPAFLFALAACSGGGEDSERSLDTGGAGADATGGVPGAGGLMGTGAMAVSGGFGGSGGLAATGGLLPTGGVVATGGFFPMGGLATTGGWLATGGLVPTGGVVATGGLLSTGGFVGTGGTTGGAATGGAETSGGASTGGAGQGGGSELADAYPCPGNPADYDAVVTKSGDTWTVQNGGNNVPISGSSSSMQAAIETALGSLNGSRSSKESVLVQGSGDVSGGAQLRVSSNTVLNVCGTINVTDDVSGSDRAPIYARGASDIDIPNVAITGHAQYGMFFRDVSSLHLGNVQINGTGGLGIRVDSHGSNDRDSAVDIAMDFVHVENTGGHGVEFYGVDGIRIGTVEARRTGDCGLILNDSINADIGLVDAVDAAYVGTGYAAFRTANTNGRYDDGSYPTSIRLHELRATGGGRGFFCVSGSGGVQIDDFTIDHVGGDPAIFIENCYNVTLASASGSGELMGGRAYIGHNSGNGDPSRDVTFQNIVLSDGAYVEQNDATCGLNNVATNVTGGTVSMCN